MNEDYIKYNLQIAGKTVKIEKAFRGAFGGAPSEFTVKGYEAFETNSSGKPRKGFTQSIIGDVVRDEVNEGPGQKHYTKDGKEWTGATHKMPDGPLMTQDPHNKDSEELFHKSDLDEVADPSTMELIHSLFAILGGSLGIKFGMDLLVKIVDKALAAAKYNATEMLKIVKNNTPDLKAAAQEGKKAFAKKLMSLIGITSTTPSDVPFTIKRNEGTCGYDTDAATGRKLKTPGGL